MEIRHTGYSIQIVDVLRTQNILFWKMETCDSQDLRGCDAVWLEFGGLHCRQQNGSVVPSPHSGPIPDATLPKGFVPHRWAPGVLHDDAWPQQRQEAHGSAHCQACLRDHPPPHRQEPHPGVRGCCEERRSSWRLHTCGFSRCGAPSGCRCVPTAPSESGHLPDLHWCTKQCLPKHQVHLRVPGRWDHELRKGVFQQLRNQATWFLNCFVSEGILHGVKNIARCFLGSKSTNHLTISTCLNRTGRATCNCKHLYQHLSTAQEEGRDWACRQGQSLRGLITFLGVYGARQKVAALGLPKGLLFRSTFCRKRSGRALDIDAVKASKAYHFVMFCLDVRTIHLRFTFHSQTCAEYLPKDTRLQGSSRARAAHTEPIRR